MVNFGLIVNGQASNLIPTVYETAQLQDNLEHSGGVSISWKSASDVEIPLGSYITYGGMRYILLEPYAPTKSGIHYQYSPMFKHPQNMLDRVPFWITSRDAGGNIIHLSTTSFTGTPFIIIKKICDFMAEYANEMQDDFLAETVGLELTDPTQPWNASTNPWKATWTFDDTKITETSKTIITVGFDGSSLKSAADAIASAMGCNLYWDWSVKKLMFISGTTITGESYNCFHVLGGTTNMGKNTVSGGYAAVTQRMTLPDSHVWNEGEADEYTEYYPGSIIDRRPVDGQGRHYGIRLTKDLILDDIYPKMELYIKTARERLCILTDNETGDFIVDHFEDKYYYMSGGERVYTQKDHTTGGKDYDADGHELTKVNLPVYKTFAKWYLTFSTDKTEWDREHQTWEEYEAYAAEHWTSYVFDQSLLINDQPLGVLFQMDLKNTENMSTLVGNQFDATYFPTPDEEWAKNDALSDFQLRPSDKPWEIEAGEFYLNFEAEGETILPSTSDKGMYPEVGKKVTLVNVALTTEEATAKEELLDAAMEIIGLMNTPAGEYSEPVIFAEPISGVQPPHTIEPKMVGDDSPFGNTHGPVVTNVDLNIDTNEATVTVGSWSRKTKTGGTADKVETVSVSAASATNGSDPYSTGDLGEGHYAPKTSSSSQTTIAQTQVKPSGAFVVSLTPDSGTVDCNASGIVKADIDLYFKISAHYGDRDVTAGCRVAYTVALPAGVTMYLHSDASGSTDTQMSVNTDYDLTNGTDTLRIFIDDGTDFATLAGVLSRFINVSHSAYGNRNVAVSITSILDGAPGGNTATVSLYRRYADLPQSWTMPSGTMWYKFSDKKLYTWNTQEQRYDPVRDGDQILEGWHLGIPAGTDAIYVTSAIAFNTNDYDDIVVSGQQNEWVTPVLYTKNGVNTAPVFLYQRSANEPTDKPSIPVYYKFADGKLYSDSACTTEVTYPLDGWERLLPTSDGTPCWTIQAAALSEKDCDLIQITDWSAVVKLVEDGADAASDVASVMSLLGELGVACATWAKNAQYSGVGRDCKVSFLESGTPESPAQGDLKIIPSSVQGEIQLWRYYSNSWTTEGVPSIPNRVLSGILSYLGWGTTFYLRLSLTGSAAQWDVYTQQSEFTDSFTRQQVKGGVGVWVYNNGQWEYIIDNTTSLVKDYGDHIVNAVFGSGPDSSTNYASQMLTGKNFAAIMTTAYDTLSSDGDKALAAIYTICERNSQGKLTGSVKIDADFINFVAKVVNVTGTFQSADQRVLIAKDMNGYNTVSIEILDTSKTHPVVGIYADHNNHPTMEFDPSTDGTVITDTYVQTKQYKVWDAANQHYIAGYNGSFVVGNYTIYVVNGIITEVRHNS